MSGNLRDVPRRRDRAATDPQGKAALFSAAPGSQRPGPAPLPAASPAHTTAGAPPDLAPAPAPALGSTVVVECSQCAAATTLAYRDLALANLPFAVWLPPVGIRFNHRLRCPACGHRAWASVRWWS